MQNGCQVSAGRLWKDLFVAALLEMDTARVPQRIAEAEEALATRIRELANTPGDNIEEEVAVDDALYALQALRSNCQAGTRVTTPAAA